MQNLNSNISVKKKSDTQAIITDISTMLLSLIPEVDQQVSAWQKMLFQVSLMRVE